MNSLHCQKKNKRDLTNKLTKDKMYELTIGKKYKLTNDKSTSSQTAKGMSSPTTLRQNVRPYERREEYYAKKYLKRFHKLNKKFKLQRLNIEICWTLL